MNNKYDVIIIGAGPAGLECAHQLKNSNKSVLIIEKNESIGPKVCAGGLTNLANNFYIPEDKTRNFAKQIIFLNKKQYNITLVNPIKTISRSDLGQYQLNKIKNSHNIQILKNTKVKEIEDNKVFTIDNQIFHFKYLVGADGSNSIVRKYLGLKSEFCFGFYYEIPKITNDFIWYVNPKELKSGYIWTFPHKNHTNIGVYFHPGQLSAKEAKNILEKNLTNNGHKFSTKEIKGSTINYCFKGYMFNRIFLVGDAAGLASKTTGEGISFALTSGKEIAKKIIESNYTTTELNKIVKIKKRQEILLNIYEIIPFLQNFLYKTYINSMKNKWFQIYFGN